MNKIEVHISKVFIPFKIKREIPSDWDELSPKQAQGIALPVMKQEYLKVFLLLSRMPLWVFNSIAGDLQEQLVSLVDFTKEFPTYPIVDFEGYDHTGDHLEHATLLQFAWADFYFFLIAKGKAVDKNLGKLAACLHSPLGKKFDPQQIEDPFFTKLSEEEKLATLLYYRGCRNKLVKRYAEIFQASTGSDGKAKEVKPDPEVMFNLINNLSKEGQYGNYFETCNTPLHNILYNKRLDIKYK